MTTRKLPDDIHPDSRARVPLPKREELDEAARKIYDHHLDPAGGSIAGLQGPGGIRLHSPRLSAALQPATRYLRREAGFSGPIRELIILVTAREMGSQFEWAAHEPEGLKEGLPQSVIDVVKYDRDASGLHEQERLIIEFGRQLFRQRRVEPALFAAAHKTFGRRQLVDIVGLMGNYASTALLLAAFDMQLPDGVSPSLPSA